MLALLNAYKQFDPSAKTLLEIALFYPGIRATALHRITHFLYLKHVPVLPRLLSEFGRFISGIEIHPGAKIGRNVIIEHGMGTVIGETAEIGDDVVILHGVTLGARNIRQAIPGKRHPTIKRGATICAGAKIIGNITVGEGACVGANAVVLDDVPAGMVVVGVPAHPVTPATSLKTEPLRLLNPGYRARPALRIVQLDCPYDVWTNTLTQKMFSKMVTLKLQGYCDKYGRGVLPFESTDLVATHLLVCSDQNGELTPLTGYKTVTLDQCRQFNLCFSPLSLARASKAVEHEAYIAKTIQDADERGVRLAYESSWTISPLVKKQNPELAKELKQIFLATMVHMHRPFPNTELITAANIRFKSVQVISTIGYEKALWQGNPLSPIPVPFAFDENVLLMYLREFSGEANNIANQYRSLWEDRLVITNRPVADEVAPLAA